MRVTRAAWSPSVAYTSMCCGAPCLTAGFDTWICSKCRQAIPFGMYGMLQINLVTRTTENDEAEQLVEIMEQ